MVSTLLASVLLQGPALSPLVMIGVAIVIIGIVVMAVYLFKRLKATEKEAEEDWGLRRGSLLIDVEPASRAAAGEERAEQERGEAAGESQPEVQPAPEVPWTEPAEPTSRESLKPDVEGRRPVFHRYQVESPREEAAPPVQSQVTDDKAALDTAFDDEVLARLEPREPEREPEQPAIVGQPTIDRTTAPPPTAAVEPPREEVTEPAREARVEGRPGREPFEPPSIQPIRQREPFEPPRITPLTPREQAAFTREQPQAEPTPTTLAPPEPRPVDMSTARVERAGSRGRVAGSILGLPAESTGGPLVMGAPTQPLEEQGIAGLSRYGRPEESTGGRAGTAALLVVLLVIGGAIGAYLLVPSFHGWVNAKVDRLRGIDAERERQEAMKPKVKLIWRPSELDKKTNMVKARGQIENISGQTLEAVTVEVALQRAGGAPPELRTVQVTPADIAANTQGSYEFEYPKDSDITGYKFSKAFSNGNEIKFTFPGQQ